jgi:hypothetical protein
MAIAVVKSIEGIPNLLKNNSFRGALGECPHES